MSGISSQMIFSPQRSSLERLDQTLTPARRRLANQIIEQYKSVAAHGGAHYTLLAGSRGSGKTHLLSYVAKRLGISNEGVNIRVIVLPEEERSIGRPFDFVLACLRAAGQKEQELREKLRGADSADPWGNVVPIFRQILDEKPTLIIAENLSDIFDSLGPENLPVLRAFFQEFPQTSLLASTISLYERSRSPDHPFYGFFQIVPVPPLNRKEARQFLRQLAQADGKWELVKSLSGSNGNARVRAIYELTGGNPRLIAMLSAFLDTNNFDDLVEPFVRLADRELTPYYQQRLDRLSPTQSTVVQAIAAYEGTALTVTRIAEHAFISPQVASRALNDLMRSGLVRRNPRGRESYYELNEPLLRLVLDLKSTGDRPLSSVVALLRRWYDTDQLLKLSIQASEPTKSYYLTAMLNLIRRDPVMNEVFDKVSSNPLETDEVAVALTAFISNLAQSYLKFEAKDTEESLKYIDAALSSIEICMSASSLRLLRPEEIDIDTQEHLLGLALAMKSNLLNTLERFDQALEVSEEMLRRFGSSRAPSSLHIVAMATVNKAHTYMDLGRAEEALQVCDELLECYKDSSDNSVLKQVATAMEIKASITADAGRFQDAAHIYRAIIERFRSTAEGRLAVHVANSFLALGDMYVALDQREQSISIIGELFEQFGDSKSVELLEILARAYLKKAIDLRQLNRTTEAVAACDEAIARFDSQEPLEIQQAIAGIMTQKAAILACVENASEANNTADQIIDLAGTANDPELDEYAGVAFVLKSIIASEANDDERALEYAERAYRLGGKNLIVIQQYMECLFASNKLEEAFQILELGLMTNSTGRGNRASLVAGAFSSTCHSSSILKRAVMLIGEDREIIVAGLTEWLRSSIPMTKESAERLGEAETVLREVLPAGLETQEVLRMLAAVRRDALGDTKALLELPLELRRLVKPELREGE